MIPCRECKEPINDGATKCPHCTAQQNWFRLFGNGAVLAGLALALVSIWTAKPIVEFFDAKKADINVSILDGDNLHMIFMVSNTGSRPAGLLQIEIQSKTKGGTGSWYLRSDLDKKLIEPGKAYVLNASNGSVIPSPISHEIRSVLHDKNISAESCDLVLQYVQMNGTKVYQYFPFPCYPVDMNVGDPLKADKEKRARPSSEPASNSHAVR